MASRPTHFDFTEKIAAPTVKQSTSEKLNAPAFGLSLNKTRTYAS